MISVPGSGKHWLAGAIAGILGVMPLGVVLQATVPTTLRLIIPALYGFGASVFLGWFLSLVHGAVLGIAYALLAQDYQLSRYANAPISGASVGFFYGLFVWTFVASTLIPIWVTAASPHTLPVPDIDPWQLAAYVAYGVVLGALYPLFVDRLERRIVGNAS